MKFGVKSDKGMIREKNEDNYNIIAGYPGIPTSFIIADGMGGHNSGEIASKMAVDIVSGKLLELSGAFHDEENTGVNISRIMMEANSQIFSASKDKAEYQGMGTTLIVATTLNKKLYIGHVGDSRLYRIRDEKVERITTDHSYIEELIKNGTISREEAENHPQKNIITRALGCYDTVEIDTYECEIHEGDIFFMCTDGLTNMLDENAILTIIEKNPDPEIACGELVKSANEKGGEDNITVIVFRSE